MTADAAPMNGAEALVRTLVNAGVDTCFTNPGTSEMHFVAALDKVEGMHCHLGLFEGVVVGAADGYARMTGKPAATLLHLGPGLGNGVANLHNARKSNSPMVNVIGEHATYHVEYDAPLTADIEGIAGPVSHWVRTSRSATDVASDGADAVAAALTPPGQIASLILPADTAWNASDGPAEMPAVRARGQASEAAIANAVRVLRSGEPTALVVTGEALYAEHLPYASAIAERCGAALIGQTSNIRQRRGAGVPRVDRVPFVVDQALDLLAPYRHVILVGAKPPVAFFAYPGKPSVLTPDGCELHRLSELDEDAPHALRWLAHEVGATLAHAKLQSLDRPPLPSGRLTPETIAAVLGACMPENAIVADESVTTGRGFAPLTAGAAPHDWLSNMGGSIGLGMPLATGAAVACPDRKVLCLSGDGSGMYTLQALWTQARAALDVTTVVFANRTYEILKGELTRVGARNPGAKAIDMLEIGRPDLDWLAMARGMGVDGTRVTDCEGFARALEAGFATSGPYVVEVAL